MYVIVFTLALVAVPSLVLATSTQFEITIPDGTKVTEKQDSYLCTTLALPDKPYKLVGVEPLGKMEIVHHILLFGCDVPYMKPKEGQQPVWDCKAAPNCGGFSETVLYGWGKDAPRLDLPAGVGFTVGKGSAVKWIVAQVHYLNDRPEGDKSGVRLTLQDDPVPFSAGLLSYASWFTIPPRNKHYLVQNSCCYRGFQPLTTFAVRVHTHAMGRAVFMTRMPTTPQGQGHVIAAGDPQKPQGFNPVTSKVIWPGEHLTVACDFDSSDKTAPVQAGPAHDNEMCNMYLMVYSALPHIEMCNDGASRVGESSPGNLPRGAAVLPDPFPLWKPPRPTDAANNSVLGNVASVAIGPDGTVWALHRGGRVWDEDTFDISERFTEPDPIAVDVVLQMHPDTGKILRRWGAGLFWMPHMITVDRNGSVWITDVGRHQALKFTSSGKLIMSIGKKLQPGRGERELCKPTQVACLNDGGFLVSDGYCNSRVMRYHADGSYASVYQLPEPNGANTPGGAGMGVAHSLVLDECDGEVAVADREFARVHRFDLQSRAFIDSVDLQQYGKVWALVKGPYGRTVALAWQPGQEASLVDIGAPDISWRLPNSTDLWPHDLALGAAALQLSGAGDRLMAVYVAPLCEACGPVQKYIMFPQSFDTPGADLPPPVISATAQKPVLAHLGGHPAAQAQAAAAAAAIAQAAEGDSEEQAALEVLEDGGQADEEDEQEDEQQEAAVEKEEEQEYKEEAKQMADPKLAEQLRQQLEEAQAQLKASQQGNAGDVEDYTTVNFAAGRQRQQGHGWASIAAIVIVSLLLAVAVGALAVNFYGRSALSLGGSSSTRMQQLPVRKEYQQAQQHSIDELLKDPEDNHRVQSEHMSLLSNGLANGHTNGVHSLR